MSHPGRIVAHLLVCGHKSCRKGGARGVIKELKRTIRVNDLRRRMMLTEVDCLDQCGRGPVVVVYPEGVWYGKVDKNSARAIVEGQIAEPRPVAARVLCRLGEKADINSGTKPADTLMQHDKPSSLREPEAINLTPSESTFVQ